MGNCSSNTTSGQGCPDLVQYLKDEVACLKATVAVLCQQVVDLKARDKFIWCKLQEEAANVDELQALTEFMDDVCGVLTLECSSSGSASFSAS